MLTNNTQGLSREQAMADITALLDAMETCHLCQGVLSLDDAAPTHCENCSGDCDEHDEPECTPLYVLHRAARTAIRRLAQPADQEDNRG